MRHCRVSWLTKLKPWMKPEVVDTPKGTLLIPTPLLLAEEISKLTAGTLITPALLRARLAKRFQAQGTCPLCTGIFFNIVAGAAEEQLAEGKPPLAPYWRVAMDKGLLSEKTPPRPRPSSRTPQGRRHRGRRTQRQMARVGIRGAAGSMDRLAHTAKPLVFRPTFARSHQH